MHPAAVRQTWPGSRGGRARACAWFLAVVFFWASPEAPMALALVACPLDCNEDGLVSESG